jgi:hypothetical protein
METDDNYRIFCNSIPDNIRNVIVKVGHEKRTDADKALVKGYVKELKETSENQFELYKRFDKECQKERRKKTLKDYDRNCRPSLEKRKNEKLHAAPDAILELLNVIILQNLKNLQLQAQIQNLQLQAQNGTQNSADEFEASISIEDAIQKIEKHETLYGGNILGCVCKEIIRDNWPNVRIKKVLH